MQACDERKKNLKYLNKFGDTRFLKWLRD